MKCFFLSQLFIHIFNCFSIKYILDRIMFLHKSKLYAWIHWWFQTFWNTCLHNELYRSGSHMLTKDLEFSAFKLFFIQERQKYLKQDAYIMFVGCDNTWPEKSLATSRSVYHTSDVTYFWKPLKESKAVFHINKKTR